MTEDWRTLDMREEQELAQKLTRVLLGNMDAVRFCLDLAMVIHAHDDIIDKDRHRTDDELNRAFTAMMVDIPSNPFYVAYGHQLRPLILSMIMQWKVSNAWETGGTEHQKQQAWMLRAFVFNIFHYCAFLVGGHAHAQDVGEDILGMYQEKLSDFLEEFSDA